MIKKKTNIEIGKRIHIARERNHYTQEVLSEKLDLSTQYLSDVERGATGISISTLIKLCETLHVSSDFLLFGNDTSDTIEDRIRMISRMSEDEQRILETAINNTLEALKLHDKERG